jgi:hypothetical protein
MLESIKLLNSLPGAFRVRLPVIYVWLHVAFALCVALLQFAHLAWFVVWLSCIPCRNWCNVIINIINS